MIATFRPFLILSTCAVLMLALALMTAPGTAAKEAPVSQKISLKKGQVLQLIAPQSRPDGKKTRQKYYRAAFPIAEAQGYQRLGQLNVRQKVVSDYDPEAFIFFSWPNEQAAANFADHPDWPALKATRPDAWSELKIYNKAMAADLELKFDPAKYYTVVVAWFDPEHPGDYDRYLTGIEAAVTREGGRFMYKMHSPTFEAHASSLEAPGQITFVEWQDPDGFSRVQKSSEYRAHAKYFGTGLTRFEFYWLESK